MNADWLDETLDRDAGEPVPAGFGERVRARLRASAGEDARAPAPILRPRFGHWLVTAAAALVFLVVGFWLGRGQPDFEVLPGDAPGSAQANLDLDELYERRELLEDFDFITDAGLELALSDASLGSWVLEDTKAPGEEEQ